MKSQANSEAPIFAKSSTVAKRLDVHIKTVTRLAHEGRFPRYVLNSRTVLYKLSEVDAYVQNQKLNAS